MNSPATKYLAIPFLWIAIIIVGDVSTCVAQSPYVTPISAVSRLTHGSAGDFDINLPLTGSPGIECRSPSGGNYKIIITFPHAVHFSSASVTAGTGMVSGSSASGNQITVNLTQVTTAQTITVTVMGVSDGTYYANVSVSMAVLVGDTTGNGVVNSSDISQTQSQSGQPVTASNFREDVTVNGTINSSDIALVQSKSGTGLSDTSFTFTLDGSYKTSAGVYDLNNTLIKTLWRNVTYPAGSNTGHWYGDDDNGQLVPAGSYNIKLLYHNVQYVWDGVIGNTSAAFSGSTPHRGSTFMESLAIDGANAFYAIGECEGFVPVARFSTGSPQSRTTLVRPDFLTGFDQVATDGTLAYVADRGSSGNAKQQPPNNAYTTFVAAYNVSDNSAHPFPNGTSVTINGNVPSHYDGVIDLDTYTPPSPTPTPDAGVNPRRPTGLAVQKSGSILAVAHAGQNLIKLFNKSSGAPITFMSAPVTITVNAPQGLATAPNGDLWVISGQTLMRYSASTLATMPAPVQTITGFSAPVAVAVHPSNNNLVLVADAGSSQVVRAFNTNPSTVNVNQALWTYGTLGGWPATTDPTVTDNKFAFQVGDRDNPVARTALAVQSDGSFWIGDGATSRLLHINSAHNASITGDTIMFLPHNGWTAVDPNNPRRVIGDSYLEFDVDYTKPIQQAWTLKKNWAVGLATKYLNPFSGINSVATLSNGRVYGTLNDDNAQTKVVVELPAAGNQPLRICKDSSNNDLTIHPVDVAADFYGPNGQTQLPSFESDGSLRYQVFSNSASPQVTVYKKALSGFDASANPQWGNPAAIGSAPYSDTDPAHLGFNDVRFPITSSNVIVTFEQGRTKWSLSPSLGIIPSTGWHLGGIPVGGNTWGWKASHSVSYDVDFDGLGSFDVGDGVNYAGSVQMALGKNAIFGYPGEFWNGGEAGQWMHFYDDGLFVGQFGTSSNFRNTDPSGAMAGFSGNSFYPTLVGVGMNNQPAVNGDGDAYLWANDESQHSGVIRWHVLGANAIQEQQTQQPVPLGQSTTLSGPTPSFATGLSATPGNQQVALSWSGPAGMIYDVKRATVSGGPYTVLTTTSNTSYTAPGLTNQTPNYFVVSPTGGLTNSNEVLTYPFSGVGIAGQLIGGAPDPFQVSSTAAAANKPSLLGLSNVFGNVSRTNIGTKGYVIYNWAGGGADNSSTPVPFTVRNNVLSPFSVTLGSGWFNQANIVTNEFLIDGMPGVDTWQHLAGLNLHQASTGTINISVSDSATHFLTVFCPDVAATQRIFTISLTPSGQTTPSASYTINEADGLGQNHIFQFVFVGNVTLTINNTFNEGGTLQALFFD